MIFKSFCKFLAVGACLAGFAIGAPASAATISGQSSIDASVLPGATALPGISLTVDAGYVLADMTLNIDYDATKVSFNLASSTIDTGSGSQSIVGFLTTHAGLGGLPNYVDAPGMFSMGIVLDAPLPITGPVVIRTAFTLTGLLPGSGTSVAVYGSLGENSSFVPDEFNQSPNISALAAPVPEPHVWAMLFAGLGLVASVRARKSRAVSRAGHR